MSISEFKNMLKPVYDYAPVWQEINLVSLGTNRDDMIIGLDETINNNLNN